MGAPNIDNWLPGEKAVIKTSDFGNAKELAEYINYLNDHDELYEEYFEWKLKGLSPNFVDKYEVSFPFSFLFLSFPLFSHLISSRNTLIIIRNAYFIIQNADCAKKLPRNEQNVGKK